VVFAGAYAGLSDSFDGASHQSITDIAIFRVMPNMVVLSPGDANDVRPALEYALKRNGPTYIRLSRNPTPLISETAVPDVCRVRKLRDGKDLTIAVTGVPTFMAVEAADRLATRGVCVDLLQVMAIKPMDEETLAESARKTGKVLTIEEHSIIGGFGSAVAEALSRRSPARMSFVGIEDRFTESGPYMPLLEKYGISVNHIERKALELLQGVQA
jgi:transketolase